MTFSDSVRYCLSNYAKFSGRALRSEYWWFVLAIIAAEIAAEIIDAITGHAILTPIVGLGLIVPNLAAAARRLHDTGRSGWWQLISLIPLIGALLLIVWLASEGESGPNRYGDAPARA